MSLKHILSKAPELMQVDLAEQTQESEVQQEKPTNYVKSLEVSQKREGKI